MKTVFGKYFCYAVLLITISVVIGSCATSSTGALGNGSSKSGGPVKISDSPLYYGTGSGSSISSAMNAAKLAAVKSASIDALGKASASANREALEDKVYGKLDVNALVFNDTMEIIDKTSDNGSFSVTLGVRINLKALSNALRGARIYGGLILPQGGNVVLADQEPPVNISKDKMSGAVSPGTNKEDAPLVKTESGDADAGTVDSKEAALINDIVNNITYMVYYDDKTVADPFIAKTAVGMANKYLSENGMEYVDMDQIEKIKKDQAAAYEEETGQSVSMLQWIAGKLNADIYIQVGVDVTSSTKNGRYYGSASVSLKNFDSSTGAGRGSAFYQTVPPAMSTVSEAAAVNNAVASASYNAIKAAVKQAEVFTKKELLNGIKYNLVMQNTSDSKLMRTFMKKLERKVKSVRRISTSPEETKYEVRLIGRMEDLEDIVYDVSDSIPGLEGIALVYQRGNSITFDTGM